MSKVRYIKTTTLATTITTIAITSRITRIFGNVLTSTCQEKMLQELIGLNYKLRESSRVKWRVYIFTAS